MAEQKKEQEPNKIELTAREVQELQNYKANIMIAQQVMEVYVKGLLDARGAKLAGYDLTNDCKHLIERVQPKNTIPLVQPEK